MDWIDLAQDGDQWSDNSKYRCLTGCSVLELKLILPEMEN
jgi:hypothetical protein